MPGSRLEKLDALIKAWIDEAVRDELIHGDELVVASCISNLETHRGIDRRVSLPTEMAAD